MKTIIEPIVVERKTTTTTFNMGSDAMNDDWIRSARLMKSNKKKDVEELKELEKELMFLNSPLQPPKK